MLLPLYLRKETSTGRYASRVHKDVVAYRDPEMTQLAARWPWHYSDKPRKGCKTIMFNCYKWRAVWEEASNA